MATSNRILRHPANYVTAAAGLALMMLCAAATPAHALYEFATLDGSCDKIDEYDDGWRLRLPLGTSRVVLWGYAMDTVKKVMNDLVIYGVGDTDVDLVEKRTGSDNQNGPCHWNIGSIVVDITNGPSDNRQNFGKKLRFRLAGFFFRDENAIARVPMTAVRFPRPTASFAVEQFDLNPCLSPDVQFLFNNQTLRIRLPAGHQSDESNCQFSVAVRLTENEDAQVDVDPGLHLTLSDAPAFVQLSDTHDTCNRMNFDKCNRFTLQFDAFRVRELTTPSNSNIRFRQPNGTQSNALRVEIIPNLGCGFARDPTVAPGVVATGDPFDVVFQIVRSPQCNGPQQIYYTINKFECFDFSDPVDFPDAENDSDPKVRQLREPIAPGQSTATVTMRALANPPSDCAARQPNSTRHVLKAFFPGTVVPVCPQETCRTAPVSIFRP